MTQKEGPKALHFQKTARRGEQLQLLPLFLDSPGGEHLEPLPAVETSQQTVADEVGPQLTNKDLPRRLNKIRLPLRAPCIFEEIFQIWRDLWFLQT